MENHKRTKVESTLQAKRSKVPFWARLPGITRKNHHFQENSVRSPTSKSVSLIGASRIPSTAKRSEKQTLEDSSVAQNLTFNIYKNNQNCNRPQHKLSSTQNQEKATGKTFPYPISYTKKIGSKFSGSESSISSLLDKVSQCSFYSWKSSSSSAPSGFTKPVPKKGQRISGAYNTRCKDKSMKSKCRESRENGCAHPIIAGRMSDDKENIGIRYPHLFQISKNISALKSNRFLPSENSRISEVVSDKAFAATTAGKLTNHRLPQSKLENSEKSHITSKFLPRTSTALEVGKVTRRTNIPLPALMESTIVQEENVPKKETVSCEKKCNEQGKKNCKAVNNVQRRVESINNFKKMYAKQVCKTNAEHQEVKNSVKKCQENDKETVSRSTKTSQHSNQTKTPSFRSLPANSNTGRFIVLQPVTSYQCISAQGVSRYHPYVSDVLKTICSECLYGMKHKPPSTFRKTLESVNGTNFDKQYDEEKHRTINVKSCRKKSQSLQRNTVTTRTLPKGWKVLQRLRDVEEDNATLADDEDSINCSCESCVSRLVEGASFPGSGSQLNNGHFTKINDKHLQYPTQKDEIGICVDKGDKSALLSSKVIPADSKTNTHIAVENKSHASEKQLSVVSSDQCDLKKAWYDYDTSLTEYEDNCCTKIKPFTLCNHKDNKTYSSNVFFRQEKGENIYANDDISCVVEKAVKESIEELLSFNVGPIINTPRRTKSLTDLIVREKDTSYTYENICNQKYQRKRINQEKLTNNIICSSNESNELPKSVSPSTSLNCVLEVPTKELNHNCNDFKTKQACETFLTSKPFSTASEIRDHFTDRVVITQSTNKTKTCNSGSEKVAENHTENNQCLRSQPFNSSTFITNKAGNKNEKVIYPVSRDERRKPISQEMSKSFCESSVLQATFERLLEDCGALRTSEKETLVNENINSGTLVDSESRSTLVGGTRNKELTKPADGCFVKDFKSEHNNDDTKGKDLEKKRLMSYKSLPTLLLSADNRRSEDKLSAEPRATSNVNDGNINVSVFSVAKAPENHSVTQEGTSGRSSMEGDSSQSTTTGTLPSRSSPIGWEKTPPMDVLDNDHKGAPIDDDHSSGFSTCSETDSKLLEEVKRQGMGLPPNGRIKRQKNRVLSITSPTKPLKYKAKDVLSGKAKMKLSIYKNCGLVTVHVMRAAYLSHRYRQVNAYVKVSIYPEEGRQTSWKTSIVKGSNNPVFDQKLSFEVTQGDHHNRVLLSVWHRDLINRRSNFLGCMSFGIQHILEDSQGICGWYLLLTEVVGRRKHFAKYSSRVLDVKNQNNEGSPLTLPQPSMV